jgi:CDP-diacylglycerol--glycerol-3-phosphate 3-phosphatidyltransferase
VTLAAFLDEWSALHGGHVPRGITRHWLSLVYAAARPLAAARVDPFLVTVLALAGAGGVVAVARWPLAAFGLVVVSGLLDNLDGAVAILRSRVSRLGFVVDSAADRLADGLFLVGLWRLGAPAGWCVGAGAAVWLLEYVRARAGNAGLGEIGVVTVGERPTRVIVTAMAFAAAPVVGHEHAAVAGAVAVLGLGVVGLVQLSVVAHRALR